MNDRIRPVTIISTSSRVLPADPHRGTDELAFEVARDAVERSGMRRRDIELTVSASSDMLEGRPFNFVKGLEALGAHPAIHYRHVEMDGAWALYEAWVALQAREFDTALIVAWSKTSEASLHHVTNTQLDPFTLAPLGLGRDDTAALQADAFARRTGEEVRADPAPTADGACAVVLSCVATEGVSISGADHRTESGALGHRDLSRATSASRAFERAAQIAGWRDADVADVHASYAHQVPMLNEAFGRSDAMRVEADPIMATGLIRVARAAERCTRRALAHATAGHAMQQNAVFLLEASA